MHRLDDKEFGQRRVRYLLLDERSWDDPERPTSSLQHAICDFAHEPYLPSTVDEGEATVHHGMSELTGRFRI